MSKLGCVYDFSTKATHIQLNEKKIEQVECERLLLKNIL